MYAGPPAGALKRRHCLEARAAVLKLLVSPHAEGLSLYPMQAMLVDLDPGSGHPLMEAAMQVLARSVRPGQHVLVKPGEQV